MLYVRVAEQLTTPMKTLVLIIISTVISCFAGDTLRQYNPRDYSTGLYMDCPQSGDVKGDTALNVLKNRDLPPKQYLKYTIPQLLSELPDLPCNKRNSRKWTKSQLQTAMLWESKGVAVEGYLVKIKPEGKEACNCYGTAGYDYHLWLAETHTEDKATALVVEISPRLLSKNPNWKKRTIDKLITQHSKVRISGWLMWDSEHCDAVGEHRVSSWEIHPIHRIEVWSGGEWREL